MATSNYIGYIIGALAAASFRDIKLKYKWYKILLVISVFSTAGMGATTDMILWSVLRLVSGIASVAGMLMASGLILNWFLRKGMHQELGLHFTGIGAGILISGIAVASMSSYLSWSEQWYWLAILGSVFLLPAWLWMPKPVEVSPESTNNSEVSKSGGSWIALLIAFYFCTGFGYAVGATFIVAILAQMEFFSSLGGVVWVVVGAAAIPSSFLWDKIARVYGTIFALIIANVLETVALLVPYFTESALLNIAGAMLFGSAFVGIVSMTLSLVGRRYPHNPTKAMAKLTISYGVAQIIAPAAAGYFAVLYGSYSDSLLVTAVVLTIGTLFLLILQSHYGSEQHARQDRAEG